MPLPWTPPGRRLRNWCAQPGAVALVSDGGAQGRYSYLMSAPVGRADLDDENLSGEGLADYLRQLTAFVRSEPEHGLPPFSGGLIGVAGFELGLRLEKLAHGRFRVEGGRPWPDLSVRLQAAVLAFDHQARTLTAVGRGETAQAAEAACGRIAGQWEATPESAVSADMRLDAPLQLETPDRTHEDKVRALVARIHAGDLFQANLARGWTGRLREGMTPADVMAALQAAGSAPFGAYLDLGGGRVVVSNSPERFIRLDAAGRLETRPIKGTRPRGATPEEDAGLARELELSAKDRAENLMIVDLMRHDLARVAEIGSVRVEALNARESYPNVHHLVSTVTARLKAGKTAADVLAATLPPGSVSGAPKVQAMKVIAAMEAPRGPYCGALFTVDAGGAMDSSVLIRTIAFEADGEGRWRLRTAAGGGIVADSDPVAERMETETKLSLIKRVLEGK
ncbi:MAG: anthranilate synthase component I family protein [Asticcacaulis sp.]